MDQVDPPARADLGPGRDVVLVVGVALACLTAVWVYPPGAGESMRDAVGWSVALFLCALITVMCAHLGARLPAGDPGRRLWWTSAASMAVDVLCCAVPLLRVQLGLDAARAVHLAAAGFLLAALVLAAGLVTFPAAVSSSRFAFWCVQVDAGTMVVAVGAATWYLRAQQSSSSLVEAAPGLLTAATTMAATFGTARIALSYRFPYRGLPGLLWLAAGVLMGVATTMGHRNGAGLDPAILVLVEGLIFAGVGLMLRQPAGDSFTAHPRDDRQRSPLPYLALALAFATLVVQLVRGPGGEHALVAAAGAIVVTALVVVRQLAAFSENERLLGRLRKILVERDDLAEMLQRMAFEDPLTGVANRARFARHLADVQAEAARMNTSVAVLLIDLDDFKPVNDRFGHAAGDAVLRECVDRIRACLRDGDLLARIGGDEFAVVLRQSYKLSATTVADRIVHELSLPITVERSVTTRIGASIGVATDTGGRRTPDSLLHEADVAMYRAKESGKGTVGVS